MYSKVLSEAWDLILGERYDIVIVQIWTRTVNNIKCNN